MATALDVIRRALRIVGAVAPGETPAAADVQDALLTLNTLLAEWYEAGVGIPDYSASAPFASLSTDLADLDAMAYQLAFRIGPEYGFEPSPAQMMAGDEAFSRLRLRYFQPGKVSTGMPSGERG